MINQWWFKLYTKKYLLGLLKTVGVCIVVDFAMTNFAGSFKYFATFLAGIPLIALVMKNLMGSLRGNIEFHKMSIPFTELKSALLKDVLISVFATFFSSVIIILFSTLFGGVYSTKIGQAFLSIIPHGMGIFLFSLAFFCACYILMINKDRKYLLVDRSTSRITNFINSAGISMLALLFLAVSMLILPSPHFVLFIAPSSIFIGALLFHQKAIFHQYRPKGRLRDFAKFWTAGTAVCFSLYFSCLVVSRQDVLNENLNQSQRAGSFEFNSRYNPAIDVETFKKIERLVSYDSQGELYEKLDFDPSTLGLDYYLDDKDEYSNRLGYLLRYGKPRAEFLVVLYDHFEKNPEYWKVKKNFPLLQYAAFARWPKKEKLPDRFIVAKQSSHELYKRQAAERKARRELASQQEE